MIISLILFPTKSPIVVASIPPICWIDVFDELFPRLNLSVILSLPIYNTSSPLLSCTCMTEYGYCSCTVSSLLEDVFIKLISLSSIYVFMETKGGTTNWLFLLQLSYIDLYQFFFNQIFLKIFQKLLGNIFTRI